MDCDDICMYVVNKYFELLEFVLNSIYDDLKYNEIYLAFTARLCDVCSHLWSVCEIAVVLYVDTVVDKTVMWVLLFALDVIILSVSILFPIAHQNFQSPRASGRSLKGTPCIGRFCFRDELGFMDCDDIFGLSVRLPWYSMWIQWLIRL